MFLINTLEMREKAQGRDGGRERGREGGLDGGRGARESNKYTTCSYTRMCTFS